MNKVIICLVAVLVTVRAFAQTATNIIVQPTNLTVLLGSNVLFTVTASGTGPFSYQWQFNSNNLPNDIITTVAGNGSGTYSGDGVLSTNTSLNLPADVAADNAGNFFVADQQNHRVRKISTNGIITTIAGNGIGTFSGDGGLATNASLNAPTGIAIDSAGNLFIADQANNRIREVLTNGQIQTVAGNGASAFSGDGSQATNASLHSPTDVALDSFGNFLIADNGNNRIRKVGTNGVISTLAGNSNATFAGDGGFATNASLKQPSSITFDVSGNFYIADFGNYRIRKVATGGVITTAAGNGTSAYSGDNGQATNASLSFPWGAVVDKSGNLFIADWNNNRIRKVATNGIITSVAGNGTSVFSGDGGSSTNAGLHEPTGIAFDFQGNLLIAESQSSRVRKIWYSGIPSLTLSNMTAANFGYYSVVISNSFGSVTSAVSTLTVILPPMIPLRVGTNKFSISWGAVTGMAYQVQYKTNLNQPSWVNFGTPINATNYSLSVTDLMSDPMRFYRAKLSP